MQSAPMMMPVSARPRRGDACLRAMIPSTMATAPAIRLFHVLIVFVKGVVNALLDIFLGHACLPRICAVVLRANVGAKHIMQAWGYRGAHGGACCLYEACLHGETRLQCASAVVALARCDCDRGREGSRGYANKCGKCGWRQDALFGLPGGNCGRHACCGVVGFGRRIRTGAPASDARKALA